MDISINKLQKMYGRQLVLDIDHLHIAPGELVGIIGNNGAGKTTFFRLVLDLIKATQGEVKINGQPVAGNDQWKTDTGSFLDEGFLIDFLTPEEYFRFCAKINDTPSNETDNKLQQLGRFMNEEIMDKGKYIRQFSTGNKQKIGIIAAMLSSPRLLILDEPFNFLDPTSQILIKRMLKQENTDRQTTMLISSHNLNHITEICSRIILLEHGRIIKDISLPGNDLSAIETYFSVSSED
jgi:ABC-2 type transport system ATP-binding protein